MRSLFPRDEVAALIAEQNAFYRGEYDLTPPFIWPQIRSCQAKTRKHPCASFFCSGMAKLTRDGRLASQIKDNFNLNQLRFWHDQLLYEEPHRSKKLTATGTAKNHAGLLAAPEKWSPLGYRSSISPQKWGPTPTRPRRTLCLCRSKLSKEWEILPHERTDRAAHRWSSRLSRS